MPPEAKNGGYLEEKSSVSQGEDRRRLRLAVIAGLDLAIQGNLAAPEVKAGSPRHAGDDKT
jgi:hypothetical protein